MKIQVNRFKGMKPRSSPWLLAQNEAVLATDAKLWSGEIRPMSLPVGVADTTKLGAINTIFRWGSTLHGDDDNGSFTLMTQSGSDIVCTSEDHGLSAGDVIYIGGVLINSTEVLNAAGTGFNVSFLALEPDANGFTAPAYCTNSAGSNIPLTTEIATAAFSDQHYTVYSVTDSDNFVVEDITLPGIIQDYGEWRKTNGYWFAWTDAEASNGVEASYGPIPGDQLQHLYFTGLGAPRFTWNPVAILDGTDYPVVSYILGVPAPDDDAAVASVDGTSDGNVTSHSWVYTYVFRSGGGLEMEGPPSGATDVTDVGGGQTVTLSLPGTGPSGAYYTTGATKRIYRSQTTETGETLYYYVAEVDLATTSYEDTMGAFAEPLESYEYDPPPTGMHSIVTHPGGFMVGAVDNEVCFSEPFKAHAWPAAYRIALDSRIVGLIVYGQTVLVTTENHPYRVTGVDPRAMRASMIQTNATCMSRRSIIRWANYGVAWASTDGLMVASESGLPVNITENFLTKDEWQALNPRTFEAFEWNSCYFAIYTDKTSGKQKAVIIDPRGGDGAQGVGIVNASTDATTGYKDTASEKLFLWDEDSDKIVLWDGGVSNTPYTWRSRIFEAPQPVNLGVLQVIANTYTDLVATIYADDVQVGYVSLTSPTPIRPVSRNLKARRWEIVLTGTDHVREFTLAETVSELGYS